MKNWLLENKDKKAQTNQMDWKGMTINYMYTCYWVSPETVNIHMNQITSSSMHVGERVGSGWGRGGMGWGVSRNCEVIL